MFTLVRRGRRSVNVWPGYVDALAALLMVVIFVLLIFTLAQFLLRQIVNDQETELTVLYDRIAQLTDLLGLEQEKTGRLNTEMERLSDMISGLTNEKFELSSRVEELTRRAEQDRSRLQEQLLTIASLQQDIDALRKVRAELEARVGTLTASLDASELEAGSLRDRSKTLEARLAEEAERTLLAQSAVQDRDIRIQALSALVGEQKAALEEERQLSADAQAEVALLNQQISSLQQQLAQISQALELAEVEKTAQAARIEDLGQRLNIELARRVNELQGYRSEFFGKLRELLGDNPDIRVVGDRFVFQAELLFASGSAELGDKGKRQLAKLAVSLRDLAGRIPEEIDWILRIDGHTDRVPIATAQFASNWELSTARAVSVVDFLASQGIPQRQMAAAGFGEYRPIDPGGSPEAYRRNRRIEIKLTSP